MTTPLYGGPLSALCPACGSEVLVPENAVLGELLFCQDCGVELELIRFDPPALEFYEEEEK